MSFWDSVVGDRPKWVVGDSLTKLIREEISERRAAPTIGPKTKFRASGVAKLCMREEALCWRDGVRREEEIDADLWLTFQHGHGIHWVLQHNVLPALRDKGVKLWGIWTCGNRDCSDPRAAQPGSPLLAKHFGCAVGEKAFPYPDYCPVCGCESFDYEEITMEDQYFTGHCDGVIEVPWMETPGVFEAKTISDRGFIGAKAAPLQDHVIQVNLYMHMLGLKWATILYWNKGGRGVNALAEHTVTRDDALITSLYKGVDDLRNYLEDREGAPLPERICATKGCPRASRCAVSEVCFAEES